MLTPGGRAALRCTAPRLSPPLLVSKQEATVALDILEEALTLTEKENQYAVMEPATLASI
jgi:hypothetical protein